MTEYLRTRRSTVNRRTLLAAAGGAIGFLSGCLLPGNDDDSYTTDNYAYLTVNDEDYYDYFTTGFTSRQHFTTEFTSKYGALRVNIPEGAHYGSSMGFLTEEQWDGRCEELHSRWEMYVPKDFEIEHQCKLHAIANLDEHGWGGRTSDGTGGWSSRISLHPYHSSGLGLEFYTYHADMENWGDHDRWGIAMPQGEWVQLDFYAKVNTPGEYDGEIRGWINGELGHEVTGLKFRETGYEQYAADLFWFNIYHGGNAPSPTNNTLVFEDLELWRGKQMTPSDG